MLENDVGGRSGKSPETERRVYRSCRIRLGWTAGRDMGALVNYMDGLRCE